MVKKKEDGLFTCQSCGGPTEYRITITDDKSDGFLEVCPKCYRDSK